MQSAWRAPACVTKVVQVSPQKNTIFFLFRLSVCLEPHAVSLLQDQILPSRCERERALTSVIARALSTAYARSRKFAACSMFTWTETAVLGTEVIISPCLHSVNMFASFFNIQLPHEFLLFSPNKLRSLLQQLRGPAPIEEAEVEECLMTLSTSADESETQPRIKPIVFEKWYKVFYNIYDD